MPEVIREVAARGHEIASKGYHQRSLSEMSPIERCRLLRLVIEKVDYDGSQISIAFHPTGFSNLLSYISNTAKEVA